MLPLLLVSMLIAGSGHAPGRTRICVRVSVAQAVIDNELAVVVVLHLHRFIHLYFFSLAVSHSLCDFDYI